MPVEFNIRVTFNMGNGNEPVSNNLSRLNAAQVAAVMAGIAEVLAANPYPPVEVPEALQTRDTDTPD